MHDNISSLKCLECSKKLTGKQTKFCSKKCKTKHFHKSNKKLYSKYRNKRRTNNKNKLIKIFGGKCQKCGYNKNPSALAFHHMYDKSFNLDITNLVSKSWASVLEEVKKCMLLCHNCHAEEHYPHLNEFKPVQVEIHKEKLSNVNVSKVCIVCESPLSNNQKKYCSGVCKDKLSNEIYQSSKIQMDRCINRKIELIEALGAKCDNCGYNKNLAALVFHHIDPSTKLFTLDASNLANRNFDKCKLEASKCKVLCHNCHYEHHQPHLNNT